MATCFASSPLDLLSRFRFCVPICFSLKSTTLVGCRSKGVSVFDLAIVLHFVLAVERDSLAALVSVRLFPAATGVWWFSCLWPLLLAFGVRSHPSASWVCLSLLWWCAWQLCVGWSQIMEYGDYSPFCSVRHLVQVALGLIIARFGC